MDYLERILNKEGIVIRKIPKKKTCRYLISDKAVEAHKRRGGKIYTREDGRKLIEEEKIFSLGGKYLVTFEMSQDSMIQFNKGYYGVGDTIKEAFEDYFKPK